MVRPVPAGRRGSCCTPYSRLQEEIDNVETIAVTANNTANNAAQTAQQALTRDTFDDVNVNGDLNVYGDIIQQGAAYETHAQHVFSTDDYIVMRDGALVGLAVGDYSGFQVKKYDGTNDGRLVIDRDGTARVGDVGDEQPLLTRDESADMVDAAPLVWDAANSKAVSGTFPVPDPGVASINGISPDADNDFTIEAGSNITITSGTNKITIAAAGGGGTWTLHTSTNWSDFMTANGNNGIEITKDCFIIINDATIGSANCNGIAYLPKGLKTTKAIGIPLQYYNNESESGYFLLSAEINIRNSDITSANVGRKTANVSITVNSDFTVTCLRSSGSVATTKSNLIVYTKD